MVLLSGYQTPAAIRRTGVSRLETWLHNRKVRNAAQLAKKAVEAAERQYAVLPGEKLTAQIVHTLTQDVMRLTQQIKQTDQLIKDRFRRHRYAEMLTSMPGMGLLSAEFLVATGGDIAAFETADRLAGSSVTTPRCSTGKRPG